MDAHAQKHTGSDCKYAFIITNVGRRQFAKKYGKKLASSFETPDGMENSNWATEDSIVVAEYYWIEETPKKLLLLQDGQTIWESDFLIQAQMFPELKDRIHRERTSHIPTVRWCKMTRDKMLEEQTIIPGHSIPIARTVGYMHNDQGYDRYRSLVYDAIDLMRIFNYWKTSITETLALAPKAPYIVTPEQIEGFEWDWKDANTATNSCLFYNNIPGLKKPAREAPVPIPSALVTEVTMTAAEIQDVIGLYAPSLGEPSNERSGRAIIARQAQANNTVFTFLKNFQEALLYSGEVMLGMMPTVYDTQRVFQILGPKGIEQLKLNHPYTDMNTLEASISNDVTKGSYRMVPAIGLNYSTKRQQTAASMLDFLQFAPQYAPIIAPRLAKLMDWEGSNAIAMEMEQLLAAQMGQSQAISGSKPGAGNTALSQAQTAVP
jgi:hypothetical protein